MITIHLLGDEEDDDCLFVKITEPEREQTTQPTRPLRLPHAEPQVVPVTPTPVRYH